MKRDVVLVGGGLAGSLIAYRLCQLRSDLAVAIIEKEERLGGNHLWSFHSTDLAEDERRWLEPLVVASWPRYEVRFPDLRRELEGGYSSISSARLGEVVVKALEDVGNEVLLGSAVSEVRADLVVLADGRKIEAALVIDARGFEPTSCLALAYQKFVGLEVELTEGHGLSSPILMDATVEQRDGYRFLYTLPFTDRSLLIEDTRYSDGAALDASEMRASIGAYAERAGWTVARIVREERGVLPIVLAGDIDAFWEGVPSGVPRAGLRAMLFHPTTGYSLPDAVRLADRIASMDSPASEEVDRVVRRSSMEQWNRQGFFRLLNRMLFDAARPEQRYRVLERFYRLSESLIQRFYAGRPSALDRMRVLTGRPPVPVRSAVRCVSESRALRSSTRRLSER
jgi:lycopene beta-cyclase